ncbi:MAG TPA: NosD domain-containing protein [Candidatus Thermoplasmatota archaeon]|nr:NosD domain-containing protein [Candidatus Thermoplasmatota archaeon]
MEKYPLIRKGFAVGIILLFVATSIIPLGLANFSNDAGITSSVQLIINDDGSGNPTDKNVDIPVYIPGSGITPVLTINFTIVGTNSSEDTAYYGDDPGEDWKNITVTGDILYAINDMMLYHVGTKGDWNCCVTPTQPYGVITLEIDWPGIGSANDSIQIINGTYVNPLSDSFPWGKDFNLTVRIIDIDGAILKYAKVCLIWEEDDYEFNETEGNNTIGNGRNGEYTFWIRRVDQGNLPPKNITIAATWFPGLMFWGYGKVMMERSLNPLLVYVDDDYTNMTPGWGYNHFNTIQDGIYAVDTNGTVLVSNGTYPENILINKSLSLLGENKNTTRIHGTGNGIGVNITANNVTINGFTIQNYTNGYGIIIASSMNRITNNIISDTIGGIVIFYGNPFNQTYLHNGYNNITENLLIRNKGAGIIVSGQNNTIRHNSISLSEYGIMVEIAESNNISQNIISDNDNGIVILGSYYTMIYQNTISKNEELGVFDFCTSSTIIRRNNFIGNGRHAYFHQAVTIRIRFFKNYFDFPITRSIWEENYWEKTRMLPYLIPGLVSIARGFVTDPPYRINFFQIDWHPAKEPFDVPSEGYI